MSYLYFFRLRESCNDYQLLQLQNIFRHFSCGEKVMRKSRQFSYHICAALNMKWQSRIPKRLWATPTNTIGLLVLTYPSGLDMNERDGNGEEEDGNCDNVIHMYLRPRLHKLQHHQESLEHNSHCTRSTNSHTQVSPAGVTEKQDSASKLERVKEAKKAENRKQPSWASSPPHRLLAAGRTILHTLLTHLSFVDS